MSSSRDYLRQSISAGSILALIAGMTLTVIGAISAAPDTHGDNPWSYAIFVGPALVTAYLALELCWKGTDALVLQLAFRVYAVGAIVAALNTVVFVIAIAGNPVVYGRDDFHYWLSGPYLIIPSLLDYFFGMVSGFAVLLVVTLPFVSVMRSRVAIPANMLSENPAFATRNRRAMIALSVLLILVFVIPTLIVIGDTVTVWVGIALIPLGVFLAIFVSVTQRKAMITELLGVEPWQQSEPDAQPGSRR